MRKQTRTGRHSVSFAPLRGRSYIDPNANIEDVLAAICRIGITDATINGHVYSRRCLGTSMKPAVSIDGGQAVCGKDVPEEHIPNIHTWAQQAGVTIGNPLTALATV